MKVELLKGKKIKGKRHLGGDQVIVDKDTGVRMIEDGDAVEVIAEEQTKTRVIDESTTQTRQRVGPVTFRNASERF